MKTNRLGRTDINVSLLCLGTMTFGLQNTQEEADAQMDYALAHGVNFFDTAELYAIPPSAETYGKTETIIGNWFAKRKNRTQVILATKVAGAGIPWIRNNKNQIDRLNIIEAVDASLKRLQTDYIDLYQLHWPNRGSYHFSQQWQYAPAQIHKTQVSENFLDVLRTLEELCQAGKIRHVGLSNETAWGTLHWLDLAEKHGLPRMVSIQNEYSLLCRLFDLDLSEIALYEDIGLLAWSPLATGMLSGKYLDGNRPKGSRWSLSASRQNNRDTPQANDAVGAYIALARSHGLDPCQMALAFVNSRPFVTSNIIGATTMEQLKSNIESAQLTLSPDILQDIQRIYRDYPLPY